VPPVQIPQFDKSTQREAALDVGHQTGKRQVLSHDSGRVREEPRWPNAHRRVSLSRRVPPVIFSSVDAAKATNKGAQFDVPTDMLSRVQNLGYVSQSCSASIII
jgi:hypothetical protein